MGAASRSEPAGKGPRASAGTRGASRPAAGPPGLGTRRWDGRTVVVAGVGCEGAERAPLLRTLCLLPDLLVGAIPSLQQASRWPRTVHVSREKSRGRPGVPSCEGCGPPGTAAGAGPCPTPRAPGRGRAQCGGSVRRSCSWDVLAVPALAPGFGTRWSEFLSLEKPAPTAPCVLGGSLGPLPWHGAGVGGRPGGGSG